MSVLKNQIKILKNSTYRSPIVAVNLAPLRPIVQRGYYTVIVLALLFNTIQQTTGTIRSAAINSEGERISAPKMCQTGLQSRDWIANSSCASEKAEMVFVDLPGWNKQHNQALKQNSNESIETQKGECHVKDQSRQI